MKLSVSNLREGRLARASYVIVGAVVSVLSLSGVVVVPAIQLEDAEQVLRASEERAMLCEQKKAALQRLKSSGEIEECRQAVALLRDHLPGPPTEIELHSAARLAARSASVELDNIGIGEKRDTGWPFLERRIFVHDVSLSGTASVTALVRFQEILVELGYPGAVSEFNLTRENVRSRSFKFRMTLDAYHVDEVPQTGALEGTQQSEEML